MGVLRGLACDQIAVAMPDHLNSLKKSFLKLNAIPWLRPILRFDKHGMSKDQEFWRHSLDTQVDRFVDVVVANRPLFTMSYRTSLGEIYLTRDNSAFFSALDELIAKQLIPPVLSGDRVLEPGCNVGAVLRGIKNRFGCEVYGVDISSRAIQFAREYVFSKDFRAQLDVGDVLDVGVFARFPGQHFSHVVCVAHLAHVPSGPAKDAYIRELQRISRCIVLYERVPSGNDPKARSSHMEDYVGKFGFTLYATKRKRHPKYEKRIGIYYYVSRSASEVTHSPTSKVTA